jgi:LmbE family N-acetylglucosaminyl deacetylase
MRVLAVVAHPDDEALGCGGALAKFAAAGDDVRVLLPLRRCDPRGVEQWSALIAAFHASCRTLGATPILGDPLLAETIASPTPNLVHDAIVAEVEAADVILSHWPGDANQVHGGVSKAVEIATRPFRRRRDVYLFEVPTSTDQAFGAAFVVDTYVVLDADHARRKREAVAHYGSEMIVGRRPEDVERRLRVRGAEAGVEFAEALHAARRFL